jgi:hypothetical protein
MGCGASKRSISAAVVPVYSQTNIFQGILPASSPVSPPQSSAFSALGSASDAKQFDPNATEPTQHVNSTLCSGRNGCGPLLESPAAIGEPAVPAAPAAEMLASGYSGSTNAVGPMALNMAPSDIAAELGLTFGDLARPTQQQEQQRAAGDAGSKESGATANSVSARNPVVLGMGFGQMASSRKSGESFDSWNFEPKAADFQGDHPLPVNRKTHQRFQHHLKKSLKQFAQHPIAFVSYVNEKRQDMRHR